MVCDPDQLITGCHLPALSNAATPSSRNLARLEGQGRGPLNLSSSHQFQCDVLSFSPKRSRKCHRSESSGGSGSDGLEYFLLSDSLLSEAGHGQLSVSTRCQSVLLHILKSLRMGSG